jgi:hypothetical protein
MVPADLGFTPRQVLRHWRALYVSDSPGFMKDSVIPFSYGSSEGGRTLILSDSHLKTACMPISPLSHIQYTLFSMKVQYPQFY